MTRLNVEWHIRQARHYGAIAAMHATGSYPRYMRAPQLRNRWSTDARATLAAGFAKTAAHHALMVLEKGER